MKGLRRFTYLTLGLSLAFFLVGASLAADVPATFWGQTNGTYYTGSTAGNITTYSLGPAGFTPKANSTDSGLTWSKPSINTGSATFSAASGGGVNAAQSLQMSARGAAATVTQTIKFPVSTIASQVAGIAKRTIPGIAVTVAVGLLANYGLSYVNDQWLKVTPPVTQPGGGRCFDMTASSWNPAYTGCDEAYAIKKKRGDAIGASVANMCEPINIIRNSIQVEGGTGYAPNGCPQNQTIGVQYTQVCSVGYTLTDGVCVSSGGSVPATDTDIDTAASQLAGDPAGAPGAVQQLSQYPWTLPGDTPMTLQTPSPVQTPSTTQQSTGPTGTTTTNSYQTITFNKAGDTISNSNLTTTVNNVTTTTTNDDPATTTTTTDDQGADSYTDTAFPAIPTLYTQKYPNGVQGVWNENKDALVQSAFIQSINSLVPTFGGGSCPDFGLTFNIAPWANFGSQSFGVPCWIYDAIGLILLVTAAFTARAIIFGG
ncbi:MAG: hypothetical protein A3F74_15950 [Betaproteobacteria bacterium RIFCSPLOWO2_12_FULL_62_58]|nr:MAG: hypothetical protein A3I62_04000 [Betaproteobacteria bacterium RIFCSPLOWO2_02_FULL_62_79]OGA51801.1 MAG: hypothetical protein A3F74_15950 [Betaproteobacteria bacterium RIFCSPLOWO2_12_FULL_62_58]